MYANTNAALLTQYKNDSVMTAGPMELIIMLYDALAKNIKLANIFLEEENNNPEKVNAHLSKAQDIVLELIRILDLKYEVAGNLMQLYEFMLNELAIVNAQKDASRIPAILDIVAELRSAWQTVQANSSHLFTTVEE